MFQFILSGSDFRGGLERQGANRRGARRADAHAGRGRAQGGRAPHIRQQTGQSQSHGLITILLKGTEFPSDMVLIYT